MRQGVLGGAWVAWAILSDGYKFIDNLVVLLAALDGVRQSGVPVEVDGCDLTERRMYVRVVCEQVRALAPALLAAYPSPLTSAPGAGQRPGVSPCLCPTTPPPARPAAARR